MKINVKYITALFAFILFSLKLIQGVWIYNTYSIYREELENKINNLFSKSIEYEVYLRYSRLIDKNKNSPSDTTFVYDFELKKE